MRAQPRQPPGTFESVEIIEFVPAGPDVCADGEVVASQSIPAASGYRRFPGRIERIVGLTRTSVLRESRLPAMIRLEIPAVVMLAVDWRTPT